jgi:hypothetical protein
VIPEFLNWLITSVAKTFDLPTRVVTVEYRQGRKAFFESVTEATDPAKQLVEGDPGYSTA